MKKVKKNIGFKKDIVRLPGQSVSDMLSDYVFDDVAVNLSGFLLAFTLLLIAWLKELLQISDNILLFSFIYILAMIFFGYRLSKVPKIIRALRQGRDGERFVGQILEEMRREGNIVYHDIMGDNFNLDHVLIGPNGVYVIETKTWSKTKTGGKATYKDGVFKVNGHELDKNPLNQAKANSKWFSDFIKKSTGKEFFVQPVVVLPGWFIEPEDNKRAKDDGVLFLNPKALSTFVKNSTIKLENEDVHLIAYHTERHIKNTKYGYSNS